MTREDVISLLLSSLTELQVSSGLEKPSDLGPHSKPLDLEEFDSLKCVEFEVLISERLGFDVENVVIPKDDPDATLTVGEIADAIVAAVRPQETPNA